MKTYIAAAVALAVGLGTPALAQDADSCLKQAFDLAQAAEGKKLPDAQLAKVEELLAKLEGQCDAKQFAEADKTAKDVQAAIDGK
jgi:hypothetical protein